MYCIANPHISSLFPYPAELLPVALRRVGRKVEWPVVADDLPDVVRFLRPAVIDIPIIPEERHDEVERTMAAAEAEAAAAVARRRRAAMARAAAQAAEQRDVEQWGAAVNLQRIFRGWRVRQAAAQAAAHFPGMARRLCRGAALYVAAALYAVLATLGLHARRTAVAVTVAVAGAETEAEAGAGAEADAETVAVAEAEAEFEAGAGAEAEAETVAVAVAGAGAGAEAVTVAVAGAEAEVEAEAEAEEGSKRRFVVRVATTLRRSRRLAVLHPRRSARLAGKPRVSYAGMCA